MYLGTTYYLSLIACSHICSCADENPTPPFPIGLPSPYIPPDCISHWLVRAPGASPAILPSLPSFQRLLLPPSQNKSGLMCCSYGHHSELSHRPEACNHHLWPLSRCILFGFGFSWNLPSNSRTFIDLNFRIQPSSRQQYHASLILFTRYRSVPFRYPRHSLVIHMYS